MKLQGLAEDFACVRELACMTSLSVSVVFACVSSVKDVRCMYKVVFIFMHTLRERADLGDVYINGSRLRGPELRGAHTLCRTRVGSLLSLYGGAESKHWSQAKHLFQACSQFIGGHGGPPCHGPLF